MSRNPQHQFIPTNPGEVGAWLTGAYEELTGTTVQPASPERLFIQFVEAAIIHERVLNNYTGNQNVPSRAGGENLDALAELTHIKGRPEAKRAACKVRFFISEAQDTAVLIPKGTRVTDRDKTLVWETAEDAYVEIGAVYADVPVLCQTAGKLGNGYQSGQIDTLVDVYDYYSKCANLTATEGGADRATDEEFYELMRESMDSYSCAGARGGYAYWAKQVSTEIADVAAVSPSPGVVKLYVLMEGGELAGTEIKNRVLAACNDDEVRPLTDLVSVEDAERAAYNVAFTYYVQPDAGRSGADIAAAVRAAVDEYAAWQCAKLGRDINPSRLIGLLMQTGIKRVALTEPADTVLRSGKDGQVPQVAALGTVTITNGGYENE